MNYKNYSTFVVEFIVNHLFLSVSTVIDIAYINFLSNFYIKLPINVINSTTLILRKNRA